MGSKRSSSGILYVGAVGRSGGIGDGNVERLRAARGEFGGEELETGSGEHIRARRDGVAGDRPLREKVRGLGGEIRVESSWTDGTRVEILLEIEPNSRVGEP